VVIAFVGRLVGDKGISELLGAFEALQGGARDVHLLVAGGLEPRDPLPPATVDRLRGQARVHWLGKVADVAPVYAASDLLALPSAREGFPNVPLEAAAMELPVVATRVDGCVDAVADGRTGALVPFGEVDALAAALARYVGSAALRRAHGRAGRARVVAEFRREDIASAIVDLYERELGAAARLSRSSPRGSARGGRAARP
jgi:glycosyltransferase involved in cell wall biosynthesis